MSKYLESTIITEVQEIKDVMQDTTESLSLARLNQSIDLNKLNRKYNPDDIFYYAIQIYEDDTVKIYKGNIESDAFGENIYITNQTAALNRIENNHCDYIYDRNNPDVLMWTKDFLD